MYVAMSSGPTSWLFNERIRLLAVVLGFLAAFGRRLCGCLRVSLSQNVSYALLSIV